MARRTGGADLPLHGGAVPRWLADRMARLGAVISRAIVHHYGRDCFGGSPTHSGSSHSVRSGNGLAFFSHHNECHRCFEARSDANQGELGIYVCGGRGKHSRQTPQELIAIGDRVCIDGVGLAQSSRLLLK